MMRRTTQTLGPHLPPLAEQAVYLRGNLITPDRAPVVLYLFTPGLSIQFDYLHVADHTSGFVYVDEMIKVQPEEWPDLKTLKISGKHVEHATAAVWIKWLKRLCGHSLGMLDLRFGTFGFEDDEEVRSQISAPELKVAWPTSLALQ